MSSSQAQSRKIPVQIGTDDSLPEVLAVLRHYAGRTVELEVPDDSPILLTATEFRTLQDAAQRSQISLTVKTEDRLRVQLASMFDLIDGVNIPRRGRDVSQGNADVRSHPTGWRASESDDAAPDPISVSRKRRQRMEESQDFAPRRKSGADTSLDYLDEPESSGISARVIGRIVAILIVLGLIASAFAWYYMPEVTIRVTLKEETVSGALTYAVGTSSDGLPSDVQFLLPADEFTETIEFSYSIPATGGDVQPDKTATGTVVLRNPTDAEISVPAGTIIQNALGVQFAIDADVAVPAAADGTPGETHVEVTAVEPGTSGNVEQGAFTGKVTDADVYFSNRDAPMSGGTDVQVLEVSEEDIAAIETQVQDSIQRIAATEWAKRIPAGTVLVQQSVTTADPEYIVDQAVGERSDVVTLSGTVEATGLQYNQADLEADLETEFIDYLNPRVTPGFGLLSNTVTLGEPELISELPHAVIFKQTASATTQAIYDASSRENLVDALIGESYENAELIVQSQDAFAESTFELNPGFWLKRMPQATDRITLIVESASGDDPPATPEAT